MSSTTDEANRKPNRKLRLKPLNPSDLPPHPALASTQQNRSTPVSLRDFVREVLNEAVDFSDNVIPATFQTKNSAKKSPPSAAPVTLLSSELIRGETWFARQSVHENAAVEGTASWDEFERTLFDNHAPNEMAYTPSIYDTHLVADWKEEIEGIEGDFGVEYEEVAMEIFEMCHEMPGPLTNRVFCTLVVRAFTREGAFVVAQIPVKLKGVPDAIYANGQNKYQCRDEKKRASVMVGEYVSVERVAEQDDGNVMWEMAVASDAKGWLPMSVQKMGLPGAIVKDVGSFMKQAAEKRRSQPRGEPQVVAGAQDSAPAGEGHPADVAEGEGPGPAETTSSPGAPQETSDKIDSAVGEGPRSDELGNALKEQPNGQAASPAVPQTA